jgi:hypothetical protein
MTCGTPPDAVPTRTGWITLHASLPGGLAHGKVAIVLERTPGVSSRQELVARVFLDEYLPQVARRTPLKSAGSFVQHPDQAFTRLPPV